MRIKLKLCNTIDEYKDYLRCNDQWLPWYRRHKANILHLGEPMQILGTRIRKLVLYETIYIFESKIIWNILPISLCHTFPWVMTNKVTAMEIKARSHFILMILLCISSECLFQNSNKDCLTLNCFSFFIFYTKVIWLSFIFLIFKMSINYWCFINTVM